jgi:hypothetical protein
MSDEFRTEISLPSPPSVALGFPPLPAWLARLHFPRANETITWVYGPRFSPSWERYVTNPVLFLIAFFIASACIGIARWQVDSWERIPPAPVAVGIALVLGNVYVLGIFCGYFTRMVVTNRRIVILQGREVARSWSTRDLPRSLLRYQRGERGEENSPTINLDSIQGLFGTSATGFVEAKTILDVGKQIGRIQRRGGDEDRTQGL